jgi:hypothetical protein
MRRRQKRIPRSKRQTQARTRAFRVLADMRDGISLSRAARNWNVDPRTVRRYFGSALKKDESGHIRASKSDRFHVVLEIPGLLTFPTKSSREREEVGAYMRDANRWRRGDVKAIDKWKDKTIAGVLLITDADTLKAWAEASSGDEEGFDSLYRISFGGAA